MSNKELEALRLASVRLRDSYQKQAEYIDKMVLQRQVTVGNATKLNEEAKTLRMVVRDINNMLYPLD